MNRRTFLGSAVLAGVALAHGRVPAQPAVQTIPKRQSHNMMCVFGISPLTDVFDLLSYQEMQQAQMDRILRSFGIPAYILTKPLPGGGSVTVTTYGKGGHGR